MDIQTLRSDFPILDTGIIYLDNAATSLTPEPVLNKMMEYYHKYRVNIERGVYKLSEKASMEYENSRDKIAEYINASSSSEIIMTKNTTEGINLVANGIGLKRGNKVVTTLMEHHSNYIVWLRAKKKYGVDIEVVRPNEDGLFDIADFERTVDDRTKLVTITHVSNVLGVIVPVEEITKIAHEHGAMVLVDGAQSVPHMKVDVRKIGCDFLAFSGHKMCGPTGSGALYMRQEFLNKVDPLCIGGGTIEDVGLDNYKLAIGPARFEAGTPGIAEAMGLGTATEYLKKIGIENIAAHENELCKLISEGLREIPNVEIYGPDPKHRIGITSFNIGNLNPHDVALTLDISANIMVRSGYHCALPLMKELLHKPRGTVRVSTYLYNTKEEIEALISTIAEISASLK